jgi:Ca-activated chloride channel family protein
LTFQHPQLLWLLLVPALLLTARVRPAAIPFPDAASLSGLPASPAARVARFLPVLRAVSLALAFMALARPQLVETLTTVSSKGVDIALALDLSSSMLAVDRGTADRTRTRLARTKEVAKEFVARRGDDRVAVVAFGARAYPVAPLTLDHGFLARVIDRLEVGSIEDGTALGDGILAAVNRLRFSPAASRTAVVVTDGRSNTGAVSPEAAASAAASLGIKVHTIGIGARGGALFPVEDPLGGVAWRTIPSDLDEAALRTIASITGGRYFEAGDTAALRPVFDEIDRLEKRRIEEKRKRAVREIFPFFLAPALVLLLMEQALLAGRIRSIP